MRLDTIIFQSELALAAAPYQRSVVIWNFIMSDFMTGTLAAPVEVVLEMVTEIQKIACISQIMYEQTPKPQGLLSESNKLLVLLKKLIHLLLCLKFYH